MRVLIQSLLILSVSLPVWSQENEWEKQWGQTVAAGRKEGKVVVMGSADPVVRNELPAGFKSRFGISMEYLGGRGSDNYARLALERKAGVYTVDALMSGMANMVDYHNEKLISPLLPALILPEVLDPSKWKEGKLWFMDPEEKYILRLLNFVFGGGLYINTHHVKREELKSIKDLLHPKWRGKISAYDPTVSGTGVIEAARFYRQFGEDFVKRLYIDQKVALSRDKRQLADWLARGTYAISIGSSTEFAKDMKKQGLPVDVIYLPDSPGTLTAGNGLLALVSNTPHPNAARVFVNWIASKEGLGILGRAKYQVTARSDIDDSYALTEEIPQAGINYFDAYGWEFTTSLRDKMTEDIKELLKQR